MFHLIKYFNKNDWLIIQHKFNNLSNEQKNIVLKQDYEKPETVMVLGLVGGIIGLDRFYIGDIFIGIIKLIVLSSLFILYFLAYIESSDDLFIVTIFPFTIAIWLSYICKTLLTVLTE